MITIPLLKRMLSVGTSRVVNVLHSQPAVVAAAMRGGPAKPVFNDDCGCGLTFLD